MSDTTGKNSFNSKAEIHEGDAIMVLPYVDPKSRQFWLEMTQIISQVAISAKVVLGLSGLKALAATAGEHKAQVMNYLKATGMRLGLLANFGCYPKATVERIVL